MNNPLSSSELQKLLQIVEDKSFNLTHLANNNDDVGSNLARTQNMEFAFNNNGTNCESSGILDLERLEGFGESGLASISLNKSSAFNPGEMTGRSTEAATGDNNLGSTQEYGRHSLALDSITSHMDKQTSEIQDLMRHSIASNYSFHSKRDLTADEASLVMREAPLPVQQSTQLNLHDSTLFTGGSNMSSYFKNRCPEFRQILGHTNSPDRSSYLQAFSVEYEAQSNPDTLDQVPTRQPREQKIQENAYSSNLFPIPNKADISSLSIQKHNNLDVTNNINSNAQFKCPASPITNKASQKPSQKSFMSSLKPADVLLRNLHSAHVMASDETECSIENSLSISRIADYLGKESNISVTEILKLNNQAKHVNKKQPLSELHVNVLENKDVKRDIYVMNLKDAKNVETASSSGTMNTVISLDKLKISQKEEVPSVVVSRHSINSQNSDEELRSPRAGRSNSPSSKSHSTATTVQDKFCSFKSGESPHSYSRGDGNESRSLSPNLKYKELDKSVDWNEVLNLKRLSKESLAKEKWVEVTTSNVEGLVGITISVPISITNLTNSWLTAKFEFDEPTHLTLELPRLLLTPRRTEKFTINLTSDAEMDKCIPFTMYLKDAAIDEDIGHKGSLTVRFKMPIIQALSSDGVNKINFPTIPENCSITKQLVLISDCLVDLELILSIPLGESMFNIKSVQQINKNDVNKVLMDRSGATGQVKAKKGINNQPCRLSSGNAIIVAITFSSPMLSELESNDHSATFSGTLNVNMIGIGAVLKKVNLIGTVGSASLVVQSPVGKLMLTNEPTTLSLCNAGSITGVWMVKFINKTGVDTNCPFKVSANRIEIRPGGGNQLKLVYFGPPDTLNEGTLILEDSSNGNTVKIDITGGSEKQKCFPIKSNYNNMSWARAGRKELSLKNSTNQKIRIRCQIVGEGFMLDCPGGESRGSCMLSFGPCECRPLPIIFSPSSCLPHAGALHLVYDKESDFSRKIKLHACANNELVQWSGHMTYGEVALVRAVGGANVELDLYNKAAAPAFISARVDFNLQYGSIAAEAELVGRRCVVGRRARHTVSLRLPWPRVQKCARDSDSTAVATVILTTGPEFTRRRILRILKNESNGTLDLSPLPEHLRLLAEPFAGEDAAMDSYLEDFNESKASLNELIRSLQELKAHIDLKQHSADDNTLLIADDTVLEHNTLCD